MMNKNRYSENYWYMGRIYRYDYKYAMVEWLDNSDENPDEYEVVDSVGLSRENWDNKDARDEYLEGWAQEIDDSVQDMMPWLIAEFCS